MDLCLEHREAQAFARVVVALRHSATEVANTGDVGGAFGHRNGTASVQKVKRVAGLQNHFISRKRQFKLHQALGFAFKVVKLLEEFFGVARFEVVLTLLDFVLMENVAIGQRMLLAETVLPSHPPAGST